MRSVRVGIPASRPALASVSVAIAVLVLTQLFHHRMPLGTVLYGVLTGSLNGLLALGLVLLFRVTRSINFAYGAMGGLPAGIAASLYLGHGWPWVVVVVLALVLGAAIGLAVGALVDWRFKNSSRLVLTVASIGLAQLLGGIAIFVPRWFHGPSLIANFQTGLSKLHFEIRPVVFDGNDLLTVILVPVAMAAVSWFLLGTDAGRAVRAIADNPDRARLLGIPARRLLLGVWALSGLIAALAVIVESPHAGVPLDAATGPEILLAPLAAAVVARMESMFVAFTAAMGLGVLQAVVGLNISKQAIQTPIFLVVILLALLVQRRSTSRAEAADEGSWVAGGGVRPIPRVLRSLPEVRAAGVVFGVVLTGLALSLPALLSPARLDEVSVGLVFGMAGLSLVVLSGWAGTVSLGQFALVGIGSIVAGDLMMHLDLDFFLSMVLAGLAGAVAAVILGLPALRVRGLYLSVTTLAFAVAASDFFYNPTNFSQELPSSVLRPVLWKRFDLHGEGDLYLLCLGTLILAIALICGIRVGRPGRAILATRDNPRAASAAAVPTTRTRLMAFMISGIIAGVAGALYVAILGDVGYQTFPTADSVTVFAMAVIGGLSSVAGTLTGVALIQWIGIAFPKVQILLTGVGLLVVLTVFPAGLAGVYERLRDRVLIAIARRRGLDTSAWADSAADTEERPPPMGSLRAAPPASTSANGSDRPSEFVLHCSGVNASYGQMQVLFGVDLAVKEGEIVALLGTNGAGKSSLLRSVTGLLPARAGRITFGGTDITGLATEDIARAGLTMMPGGRGVFPTLSVATNLRVASWPLRRDPGSLEDANQRVTSLFPILKERSGQLAGDLSGGEQQMLSLAMALLVKPKLLCIDELSLGLAPAVVATLLDAVREIRRQGTTILIVEQSVDVALLLAERATFMEKGQVRFSGLAGDILERPDLLRAVFIGGGDAAGRTSVPANGKAPRPANGKVPANLSTGRGRGADRADGDAELECRDLVMRFGGIVAVDHVDLTVHRGEVVGLIGHNGAGKTTLFDVISGFWTPEQGRLLLAGEEITAFPPHERASAGLGRSFQEARLYPTLTVAETISIALDRHLASREPIAAALQLPAATDSEAAVAERVEEVINELGLAAFRHRPTGELSTGTRRIVELACVMAQRPTLLLLDEPSGGVAQAETEALGSLLRQVAAETGCAIVVIEHDMGFLSSLCHRLVALELGRVIAQGPPSEVFAHPDVIASYLGTDPATIARSGSRRGAKVKARPNRSRQG